MSQSDLIHVRLPKLTKSPDNVRQTPPSQAEQDQLKASIAARGLLQPLIVRPASRKGHFEVTAGGCRLDALKALQKAGTLKTTYAAPCLVRPDADKEDSLAENLHRSAMHPADEFAAFAEVIEQGADIEGVAERFGVTQRHVRQRLKLGKAAPELIQAYRDKQMDLEVLMAFTVSDDHDAQRAVWEQLKEQYHVSAYTVKQRLTDGSIAANSRLGVFVGADAYEKAGGAVARDLFTPEDEGYFTDATLVRDLALKTLTDAATALEADWKWAKPMLDTGHAFLSEYTRVYPQPIDPPKKVVQELERLNERYDQLMEVSEEDWTEKLSDETEELDARRTELQSIVDNSVEYTAEDKARSGCIVTVSQQGELMVRGGLIPRSEATDGKPNGHAADTASPPPPNGHDNGAAAELPATPEQVARKSNGLSQAHIDDLRAYRLQILKAHVAQDYSVAFDAALYSLCMGVLHLGYFDNPLDLRAAPTQPRSSLNDLGETAAHALLESQSATLVKSCLGLPPAEAFAALSALSADEKQALFAWCVAACLEPQLAFEDKANPVIEQIGARLNIDVAAHWRPTAENYWGRVKKDHALEVGGAILGQQWRREFAKAKKTELAKVLERVFDPGQSDSLSLSDEVRAEAAGWVPPGFAFGPATTTPDRSDTDANEAAPADGPADESTADADTPKTLPAFLTGDQDTAAADNATAS